MTARCREPDPRGRGADDEFRSTIDRSSGAARRFVIAMSPDRHIPIRMTASVIAAASFCAVTALLHTVSIIFTIIRCRPRPALAPPRDAPPVTIVRPVCGLDNFVEETLRTSFELDYPEYELIFCVASERDPVVPVVRDATSATFDRPHRRTSGRYRRKLLVGDDRISTNPKLNNCVKGWRAAAHPFVAIADSNVLMPRDYIQRLLAAWRPDTGLVCSPPQGCRPIGLWANLECAFLNSYQARAQYFADTPRHRLRPGQDDAVALRRPRSRRRHSRARAPKSRRMPPRPRSCAPRACGCASSTVRSSSRSDGAP